MPIGSDALPETRPADPFEARRRDGGQRGAPGDRRGIYGIRMQGASAAAAERNGTLATQLTELCRIVAGEAPGSMDYAASSGDRQSF